MGGRAWKPEDLQYIRAHYDTCTAAEIAQHLGRTRRAIHGQCSLLRLGSLLGVHTRVTWTPNHKALMRLFWGRKPATELARITGHSVDGLQNMAHALGLSKKRPGYTRKELKLLAQKFASTTTAQLAAQLGRNKADVRKQANRMGLFRQAPRPRLSVEAMHILWSMRSVEGVVEALAMQLEVPQKVIESALAELLENGGPVTSLESVA